MTSYDTIPEADLIQQYQALPITSGERKAILQYLWDKHLPFVMQQLNNYYSASSYINYDDLLNDCFMTFCEVLLKYDSSRGKLITALSLPLKHTFTNHLAAEFGYSAHENLMVSHFKSILTKYDMTGVEDPGLLTDLYNREYRNKPITVNSLKKYRDYYFMQDKSPIDGYTNYLRSAEPLPEQSAVRSDTRDRLFAYCQKAEGDDRLLLLFLFGFLYSVTIDGITYVLGQDFSFSSPLCKVYKKLFPDVALFLYNNGFIPDTNMKSLKNFLYDYYNSTPPFRHRKRKKGI